VPGPRLAAGHNDAVAGQDGTPRSAQRAGSRRASKPKRRFRPDVAPLVVGALVALAAWGLLVWLAIGFGRSARGGDSAKWAYLAGASVAAVACLFLCLWLVTVALRRVGILEERRPHRH
jgi:drug/metabolite transporter (DMT)-like permease